MSIEVEVMNQKRKVVVMATNNLTLTIFFDVFHAWDWGLLFCSLVDTYLLLLLLPAMLPLVMERTVKTASPRHNWLCECVSFSQFLLQTLKKQNKTPLASIKKLFRIGWLFSWFYSFCLSEKCLQSCLSESGLKRKSTKNWKAGVRK